MNVLVHPDPVVLEGELLRRVAAAQSASPLAPVLIVVPTARLARHVRRRIARSRGGALAIDVMHHQRLALRVLAEAPALPLRPMSEILRAALVRRVLDGMPEHPWSRFVRKRPGAVRAVASTLADLREAGIPPARAREALGDHPAFQPVHDAYARYESALRGTGRRGLTDEAGLVEAALPRIAAWVSRYAAVIHHGAYELIGIHLDLVREIDRTVSVDFLLPAHGDAPAYDTAAAFARRHLAPDGREPTVVESGTGSRLGADRLTGLYREDARIDPAPPDALAVHHAQGSLAELSLAARNALAVVAAGWPPEDVAIVARTLDAYAGDLAPVLSAAGIPWSGSARVPLRRHPAVRDLLLLLRIVADDFPRRPTCEILASPRMRWEVLLPGEVPREFDLADPFSLEASVARGFEEWTRDLPEWAEQSAGARPSAGGEASERFRSSRADECRRIARAIVAIRRRIDPAKSAGWVEHAVAVEQLARDCLRGFDEAGSAREVARFFEVLDDMRRLAAVLDVGAKAGGATRVPFLTMVSWLEQAVDETELPATADDGTGIQVLDAMQARGLTFGTVLCIGLHGGSFPRAHAEDPLLDDRARRRLREATGRPIPVKSEGDREERILLALLLGAARESIHVSWQRADETGRVRPVSLALREVARLRLGEGDLDGLVHRVARRIPAHPKDALMALAADPGLLSPDEEVLLAALRSTSASEARRRVALLRPDLDARLSSVEAVEAFSPSRLEYDGIVGETGAFPQPISASALETLGSCPLRFFFRHVLRIEEVRPDRGLFDFDSAETGSVVHDALRRSYAQLSGEGLIRPERRDEAIRRAREIVSSAWHAAAGSPGTHLARRAPVLHASFSGMWIGCLTRFIEEDLARLAERGVESLELEASRSVGIGLDDGTELAVRGRLDRIARGAEGSVVGDYKTSREFAQGAGVSDMLRGRALQVPLYSRMADRAPVELLQVRAVARFLEQESVREKRFDGFSAQAEEGFVETLRVLARLARGGTYPLRSSDQCARCPYEAGCRHDHPPTLARLDHLAGAADYYGLSRKTAKLTLLASLEGDAAEEAE